MDPAATRTSADAGSGPTSGSFDHGRFAPGARIGDRYRIVGRLGVGGMGEVYRADDLKLGQPVALKFLPEAVERDPRRLDQLLVEVRTARQIAHPNVCRVYDVGEVDGRRFLTMEYVDGEDLKSLLRRIGRLPEDKGLEIARQICAGLAAMHDRGVLHRDLKPANVMLDGRGRVRLTDFGLAIPAEAASSAGEIAGTPAYMAPEQLAGEKLSVTTDLYSLGLVLFELFTGERVRKSDRIEEARAAARTPMATLTTSGSGAKLDPMIQRVIERCVEPDPQRRPQSAIVIAAALPGGDPLAAALAAGETPSPQMVAAAGSEGRLSFKVAVPLLVVVVAGVFFWTWQRGQHAYYAKASLPHSPEVMATKAREMLTRLGHGEHVGTSAGGFVADWADYSRWINERDSSASRWDRIGLVRPSLVVYWHRTSPEPMTPAVYLGRTPGGGLAITPDDPPPTRPGMTFMQLDPQGRLLRFDARHSERPAVDAVHAAPDWATFFEEAGLDMAAFRPVTPEWTSGAESDAAAAWLGPGADDAGAELRVEAASYRGRLVFFRLIAPWTRPVNAQTRAIFIRASAPIVQVFITALIVGLPLAALGLALRNFRLGRTDTRGASRLAWAIGLIVATAATLGSSWPADYNSFVTAWFVLVSWVVFSALMSAVLYLALEPSVRRHWPSMLVSWSRLLDGRWSDPLVGRDLLIGSAASVALNLLFLWYPMVAEMRGAPRAMPWISLGGLLGPQDAMAVALGVLPNVLWVSLGIIVLLVLLRMIFRRELVSAVVGVALFTTMVTIQATDPLVTGISSLVFYLAIAAITMRFGLVMLFSFMHFNIFKSLFIAGFTVPDFATSALVIGLVAALAPGVFGFYRATRGRKASGWLDG